MSKKAECLPLEPLFDKYLDRDITVEEYRLLRTHLGQCAQCSEDWHALERSVRQLECLDGLKVSDSFMPKLMTRLPEKSVKRFPVQWRRWTVGAVAAGLLIAAVGLGSMSDGYTAMMTVPGPGGSRTMEAHEVTILPSDTVLQGNLTVVNGDVYVAGKVEGGISAVGGKVNRAGAMEVKKLTVAQRFWQYCQRVARGFARGMAELF